MDYIISYQGQIFPIEVKSAKAGRLRSLHLFIEEKKSPLGIKVCEEMLALNSNILTIPFYLLSELPRLLGEVLS